jgi:hypothetical protein
MGTVTLPTNLPTVNKKFITQAYAQWLLSWPNIFVSVMHEDGTPVQDLEIKNFKVARIGNGAGWVEVPISDVNNWGNSHGIYFLLLQHDAGGLNWNFFPDSIFTVEAFKTVISEGLSRISYRGQCLAPQQSLST